MLEKLLAIFYRPFCQHAAIELTPTGAAVIVKDRVILPGVEIRCTHCGEFWHAELDATQAIQSALG